MTITRIRLLTDNDLAVRDEYGDFPEDDDVGSTVDRLVLHGCLEAPRTTDPNMGSSEEVHDPGRDGLVEGKRLFSHDPYLDVRKGDDIDIDGTVWTVEGNPSVWGTEGCTVSLMRSEG